MKWYSAILILVAGCTVNTVDACVNGECNDVSSTTGMIDDEVAMLQMQMKSQNRAQEDASAEENSEVEEDDAEEDAKSEDMEVDSDGGILGLDGEYEKLTGDCFGNDLKVLEKTDEAACAAACDAESGCAGFSHHAYGYGRCILKSLACDNPIDFHGWIFFKKPSAPVIHDAEEVGCPTTLKCKGGMTVPCPGRSPGPWFQKLKPVATLNGCLTMCKWAPKCKAIIYHKKNKTCFLLKRKFDKKYLPVKKEGHFVANKC